MHRVWLLVPALIASFPTVAQSPRSIVGNWHFPGQKCTRDDGMITIKPLALESADVRCRFSDVRREGDTVIWQGTCDDAEGGARQKVIARETEKGLQIRYVPGGNTLEGLRRCP